MSEPIKYVAYFRVSTKKQEESQLSIIWQKNQVKKYVEKEGGVFIREFTETETGTRKRKRVEIFKAIELCKETGAVLLVAKLDRLSRDVEFTYSLLNSNVKFIALDMPGANETTIGLLSVIAQGEAKTIRERIKASVEVRRTKGTKMGKVENFDNGARERGWKASAEKRRELAEVFNKQLAGHIIDYRTIGWSYARIASRMNELNHKTSTGKKLSARQAEYLYKRYKK